MERVRVGERVVLLAGSAARLMTRIINDTFILKNIINNQVHQFIKKYLVLLK